MFLIIIDFHQLLLIFYSCVFHPINDGLNSLGTNFGRTKYNVTNCIMLCVKRCTIFEIRNKFRKVCLVEQYIYIIIKLCLRPPPSIIEFLCFFYINKRVKNTINKYLTKHWVWYIISKEKILGMTWFYLVSHYLK
jgi:hypothetical protein